jgi:anthranilate synthase component I
VPIFATIPGYFLTPSSAYLKISQGSSQSFLLESVVGGDQIGRYSWIGANPFHVIESGPSRAVSGDPLIELERVLKKYRTVNVPGAPPFQGTRSYRGYANYVKVVQLGMSRTIASNTLNRKQRDLLRIHWESPRQY